MDSPFLIAPSILSADFARLGEEIKQAEANGADWIHVDVMDGHFVPNLTMGPVVVEACKRATDLPLDVHLMVTNPDALLKPFAEAGASNLTVHVEACPNLHRTLQMIQGVGCKAGVALNPGTPAATVEAALHMLDIALVMTVNPGYAGQAFLPETLPKIAEMKERLRRINPKALLEVDGGIDAETLPQAKEAGAQVFVAASAVFKHAEGIAGGMRALREAGS